MADDLSIVLGVKLNEADLSSIESKINSVVKGKKGDKVKIDFDKTINTQLANLKKSLDSITAKPYKINFQVDQNFTKEIDKITGNMKKAIEEVQKYKKEFGDSVSGNNLPAWNKVKGGFNTLKEYRDELQKQVDSYVKDLSTQGAKNIKTSISATYDKQGNATYKGLVEYENAVGKVTKAVMELDNATKTWRVNSTNVTTNYSKQAKELKDYNSLIEKHQQEITKLTSEAFNQKSPLKDQFAETANAALAKYTEALNEVKNAGNKVSDEAKTNLERVRNEAKIAIAEAKASQTTARNDRPKDISSEKIVAGNDLDKQVATFERMGALTDSLRTKYDELKQSLANVSTGPQLDEWRDKLDAVKTEAQAVKSQMDLVKQTAKFEIDTRNIQTDLENVKKKYQEIIELNPDKKSTNIEEHFEKVQQAINNMNPQTVSLVRAEMTGLRREVNGLQPQVTSFAQALQQSFGSIGQYISRFVSATYLLSKGIRTVKSMVNEVKTVDSSLVELQKVTDLTGSSLDQFVEKAYNVGKGLGRTGQDVIDATTTFSRAGYNLQEATKLAQSALVMTNVGVDIPNMESAASDMISVLKAFDIQAEDSMEVIDKLYNVSNKQPLDFGNLTQMLVTAGGTLAQTGTTLDQTMGLLTGAFATLRDTSVSNGLIMISQRLRGVNEEGEALEKDFVPKLKEAFGDIGVSIEDQNGELKSTYEILDGLASKWDTLSSKQKQYIGEKAAGNRQVKTLNAIMQNWDVVKSSIEDASEAAGTAIEGNELYMDSIEGRVTQLKSAFQDLAQNTINSDLVKGFVSLGTSIVNLATEVGGLDNIVLSLASTFAIIKWNTISDSIKKFANNFKTAGSEIGTVTNKISKLRVGLGAAVTALSLAISIYNSYKAKQDEARVKTIEAGEAASEQAKTLASAVSKYEKYAAITNRTQEDEANFQSAVQEVTTALGEKAKVLQNLTAGTEDYTKALKDASNQALANLKIQNQEGLVASRARLEDRASKGFNDALPWNDKTDLYYSATSPLKSAPMTLEGIDALDAQLASQIRRLEEKYEQIGATDFEVFAGQMSLAPKSSDINDVLEFLYDMEALRNRLLELEQETGDRKYTSDSIYKAVDGYVQEYKDDAASYIQSLFYSEYLDRFNQGILPETAEDYENIADSIVEATNASGAFENAIRNQVKELSNIPDGVVTQVVNEGESRALPTANLYSATEAYKTLTDAMTEQQKAGVLSYDTWRKLIDPESGLAGISDYLTLTANGYALNTDAIYDYIEAQNKEERLNAVSEIQKRAKALENLEKKRGALTDEEYDAMKITYQSEIEQYSAIVREIDAATSALTRYAAAKQTANEDSEHTEGASLYSDLTEIWESGKIGSDEFKSGMDFLLGEGWLDNFEGDVDKAWKAAKEIGDKYFGEDDQKSAEKFEKALVENQFAEYNENGGITMLTNGDVPFTLDQIAEKLGITEEAAQSLFGLLNSYSIGDKIEFTEEIISEEELEVAEKKLEELNTKLEQNKKALSEMNPEDAGYEELATQIEEDTKEIDDLDSAITTTKEAMDAVASGETLSDAMSLDEALQKLNEYRNAIDTLTSQGLRVPVELTQQYTELENLLANDGKSLTGPSFTMTVTDQDDVETKIKNIKDALDKIQKNPNISPEVKGTITEEGQAVINALESINKTDFSDGPKTITVNADGTVTIKANAEGLAEDLSTASQEVTTFKNNNSKPLEITINQDTLDTSITETNNKIDELTKPKTIDVSIKVPSEGETYIDTFKQLYENALDDTKEQVGEFMQNFFGYGGSVDLTNRPQVPVSQLIEQGWDLPDDGSIATLLSQSVNIGENGEIGVVLTPILPDGQSIDPETFSNVLESLFVGPSGQIELPEGDWGFNLSDILVSSMDMSRISPEDRGEVLDAFGEYLSMFQDLYYNSDWLADGTKPKNANDLLEFGSQKVPTAKFNVEATDGAGEELVEEVQTEVEDQGPVEVETVTKPESGNNNNTSSNGFEVEVGNANWGDDEWEAAKQKATIEVKAEPDKSSEQELIDYFNKLTDPTNKIISQNISDGIQDGVTKLTNLAQEAGVTEEKIAALEQSYEHLQSAIDGVNSAEGEDGNTQQESVNNLRTAVLEYYQAVTLVRNEIDSGSLGDFTETESSFRTFIDEVRTIASQPQEITFGANTTEAETELGILESDIEEQKNKSVGLSDSSARKSLRSLVTEIIKPVTKTVNLQYKKTNTPTDEKLANGTKKSKKQLALVDDGNGAELIEHKSQGTYELGTNDGPRLVQLDAGDVVHTAEETKKILSRFGLFGNAFAKGATGQTSKPKKTTPKKTTPKDTTSKKLSSEAFSDYASKLYDWIEVKLDRLQEKTDRWIQKASEVTKVADKNKYLDKALKSVGEQIDANTKGQKKYLKQAAEVAEKGGLSDDMIKKIQEGSIEIGSYSSEMQTVIEEYKEWYDKAVECGDAISELKEQQTELATMKLDNIIDSYTNRVDYRSGKLDIEEQRRTYLTTAGKGEKGAKSSGSVAKELKASYKKSLETIQGKGSTKGTLYYLEQERKELEKSLNDSVSKGYIEKYSDEWYEYQQKIQDVSKEIIDYETQIVELKDAIAEVDLTQMGYKLDKETRASAAEQRKIDLNQAKGGSRMKDMDSAQEIQKNLLDSNKLLEEQNAYYRDLQKNLDPLSDKYQEYEEAIEANNEAINQNKIEYINWQDTINDLDVQNVKDKISEIDAAISRLTDNISIATQKGQKITADMYTSLIDQENAKVSRNKTLINDLRNRQNSIIKQGGSKNSDKWQELQREIEGLEAENRSSVLTIEEWKDAIEELPLTELGWSLDSITDKATKVNESISESIATGKRLSAIDYNKLVLNNAEQMKIYEEENKLLKQQQKDILKNGGSIQSQEYQELEGRIRANESAMSGLRVSTAEYGDEIRKLKIDTLTWQLEKYKETQDALNRSIERNKAVGVEQTAKEYNNLIASMQNNITNLGSQNAVLIAEQQKILAEGGDKQSQKYQELEDQIRSNNDVIDDSRMSIINWKKEIYNLKVQKYIWQYDALERSISYLNHTISMNKSTGVAQTKDAYEMMSKITKSQIKDLQDQNSVLLTEQKGMDKYSDAYQEIQNKVRDNLNSIEGLTEKLVEYQDAINQITIDNFTWQLDALTTSVDRINKGIDLNSAKGVEQTAQAYRDLIKNAEDQIKVQEKLIAEYKREQQGMDVNSEKYQELEKNIRDCESSITDLTLSTIEYTDSINKLPIQKLSWALEAINRVANSINDSMNLHEAQGIEETADTYERLIKNGMQQIDNLEQQNRLLKLQQVGLDENSEKWQEVQSQIDSNNSSINQLKVSQEQWNDAVIDLKISQLEKYKDQLSKANDQYQRQKELQEAIEELQKAQAQRTVRTYREGVGFVWEADQDQLKSAQEKLEDVIENQLLDKIDDLVEALEDYKNDTNVYDAEGNLLGTRYTTPNLESLGEILQAYYKKNELFPDMDNITSTFTQQLVEQIKGTGNTTTISFGDINLSDVNDINSFAAAIVSQLPNAILQLLNKQ